MAYCNHHYEKGSWKHRDAFTVQSIKRAHKKSTEEKRGGRATKVTQKRPGPRAIRRTAIAKGGPSSHDGSNDLRSSPSEKTAGANEHGRNNPNSP